MDEKLLAILDEQDWTVLIENLTLAALNQLKLCGWSTSRDANAWWPSGTHPQGYALDAMAKVYDGCVTGENKWDPSRGDLYPFLEWLVRRLITDDKKKYARRKIVSFDDADIEPGQEMVCSALTNELFNRASDSAKNLILILLDQIENGELSWTKAKSELGISEHRLSQLRAELANLLADQDPFSPK